MEQTNAPRRKGGKRGEEDDTRTAAWPWKKVSSPATGTGAPASAWRVLASRLAAPSSSVACKGTRRPLKYGVLGYQEAWQQVCSSWRETLRGLGEGTKGPSLLCNLLGVTKVLQHTLRCLFLKECTVYLQGMADGVCGGG